MCPAVSHAARQEGQGLGKSRQGITTPLVAQKTTARSGVIVNAKEQSNGSGVHQDKRARVGPAIQVLSGTAQASYFVCSLGGILMGYVERVRAMSAGRW
jgi:hypothetical protein